MNMSVYNGGERNTRHSCQPLHMKYIRSAVSVQHGLFSFTPKKRDATPRALCVRKNWFYIGCSVDDVDDRRACGFSTNNNAFCE